MTQRDINGSISLDRTWELCLEMWEYIAKMWLDPNNEDDVLTLKEKWLNKNGYKNSGIAQIRMFEAGLFIAAIDVQLISLKARRDATRIYHMDIDMQREGDLLTAQMAALEEKLSILLQGDTSGG